jgi:hypothetical protein
MRRSNRQATWEAKQCLGRSVVVGRAEGVVLGIALEAEAGQSVRACEAEV